MHIRAVKEPWRRSNRYGPLPQMVKAISRLDKLAALHRVFDNRGMLEGTTSDYVLGLMDGDPPTIRPYSQNNEESDLDGDNDSDDGDGGPLHGPMTLAQTTLAVTLGMHIVYHAKSLS